MSLSFSLDNAELLVLSADHRVERFRVVNGAKLVAESVPRRDQDAPRCTTGIVTPNGRYCVAGLEVAGGQPAMTRLLF